MSDVMVALAAETVVGTTLIGTGMLLVARTEQVVGAAREGAAWLLAIRWPATGTHRGRRAEVA